MAKQSQPFTSIELFTGAGGLALGVAQAGFRHIGLYEWNRDACATLRDNSLRVELMSGWSVHEGDVHEVDFWPLEGGVTLLAAGAPCQPFSLGGKHLGDADDRNLFPEVFRAAREMRPEMVLVENVKGLLRTSFGDYFRYIELQLSYPELMPRPNEVWRDHKARLEKAVQHPPRDTLRYTVKTQLLQAADFGVPQRRERVFITAFREDLGVQWSGLVPTHTENELLRAKYVTGDYWDEHQLPAQKAPERLRRRIGRLSSDGSSLFEKRWRTVWDAIDDMPEPVDYEEHPNIFNHVGQPGARSYPGHTGSPLHEPAKTLKAGGHGVPGGENMLRRDDGSIRYFTVRESARLQTFPDDYRLQGSWGEAMRQLGNAVPVELAHAVASEMRRLVEAARPLEEEGAARVA